MPQFFSEAGQNLTRFYKESRTTVAKDSPLKKHFQGQVTPSPAPENAHKNLVATLLPPDRPLFAMGRCCPKIQKKGKREGKILNLISFELGAIGGKLMLISCIF